MKPREHLKYETLCQVGQFWLAKLTLWHKAKAELKRQNQRLWDATRGVCNLRQQDGGHGNRNSPKYVQ